MTTLDAVTKKMKSEPTREAVAAKEWVRLAKEQGLALDGPNGLLGQFTKTFLEAALNEEMTDHLGHEKNRAPDERDDSNVRNGTRPKTVISPTTGPVMTQVPRDRDGTFTPVIVPKRHRRLTGVDEIVLYLAADLLRNRMNRRCIGYEEIVFACLPQHAGSRCGSRSCPACLGKK
jgi:transposase-like protein